MSRVSIRTHLTNELQKAKPAAAASSTSGGGTNLLTVPPHPHHGADHTGALPISDLTTSETDVTKVLGPDGLGGIEVRPEASGGGTVFGCFDGGGSPVSLSAAPQDVYIRSARTITSWELIGDVSGSATIGVLRGTLADMEAGTPPSVSLTGGSDPALASHLAATDDVLSGWTTSLAAGDVVRFTLSAVDGVQTKLTLTLVTT
jgi:hypothetical protein